MKRKFNDFLIRIKVRSSSNPARVSQCIKENHDISSSWSTLHWELFLLNSNKFSGYIGLRGRFEFRRFESEDLNEWGHFLKVNWIVSKLWAGDWSNFHPAFLFSMAPHYTYLHTEVNYNSQKAKTVKTNVFVNRRAIRYITPILISDIITSLQKGQKALNIYKLWNISVFLAQYWLIAKGLSRVVLKTKEKLRAF